MKNLFLSTFLLLAVTTAKANNCPTPNEILDKVQDNGGVTTIVYLSDSCKDSANMALSCQQDGMDEYNRRMALAAQKQCEREFYRADKINTKAGKNIISRYIDLKYQCSQIRKNSDVEIALCRAEAAKFMALIAR